MKSSGDAPIQEVLRFWFEELRAGQWLEKDEVLDRTIAERFHELHGELAAEVPEIWRNTPEGCLAAILVLDQFSRNLYRQDPRAFACDGTALALAKHAVASGWDQRVRPARRTFFYLPFTHAEDPEAQARSVAFFSDLGEELLELAEQHKRIIDRFGRFPHRNAALGRRSTESELAFLEEPNSSF